LIDRKVEHEYYRQYSTIKVNDYLRIMRYIQSFT
jgi:hypothetical protein